MGSLNLCKEKRLEKVSRSIYVSLTIIDVIIDRLGVVLPIWFCIGEKALHQDLTFRIGEETMHPSFAPSIALTWKCSRTSSSMAANNMYVRTGLHELLFHSTPVKQCRYACIQRVRCSLTNFTAWKDNRIAYYFYWLPNYETSLCIRVKLE